ncbi:MAG: type IV toxin-antitoxin system AbiEi family antitoxin domain-containing protein [Gemmatimonadaceae bacterium]
MNRRRRLHEHLYGVAERQGGLFTARQAREAGYADNTHPYHVRAGNWIRERRGVYRLTHFPMPSRPDLMLWQLWSHNRSGEPQGTFSHATALTLHDLSDVMPRRLDMTVPPGFQRMAAIPAVLHLHRARLRDEDVETIDAVRVTTPLRTLVDVIADDTLSRDLQVQAVDQAVRRGRVIRRQLEAVKTTTRTRRRIDRILKQVPDGDSTPVRNGRRPPRGARGTTARPVSP